MEKKKSLIIYGDSGYAQMIAHYFETDSPYSVAAYCVDRAYKSKEHIGDIPVYDFETVVAHCDPQTHAIFAAIGYKSVRTHRDLYLKIAKTPYRKASFVSSRAIVDPTARIGENVLILPGTIVEPHVRIGNNCFVNSGAILTHHAHIGDHTIIAAGALIGGHTTIGKASLIGFRATILELIDVAEETLLAAGSLLTRSTEPHTAYRGAPAKAIGTHIKEGIVLSTQRR